MMIGSKQASRSIQGSNQVARKENLAVSPQGNARPTAFTALQPGQPYSRIIQNQFVNVTNRPSPPLVASSPGHLGNDHVVRKMIELGGVSDRSRSREKAASTVYVEKRGPQVVQNRGARVVQTRGAQVVNEGLNQRVMILETRVKQLHREKQFMAIELSQRITELEQENMRLIVMVKESDQKANDEKLSSQIDGKTEAEQFNLEEELATQIDVNLGLREEIDSMNQELDNLKLIDEKNRAEINLLEDDKAELNLKYSQMQDSSNDEIDVLKEKMGYLEESLGKKEENTRQIVEEKEKRILELEEEGYSMNHQLEERQKEHENISEELTALQENHQCANQETESLRSKVAELEQPVECKKCKDHLHMVFRLNSQLNRK